MLPDSSSSWRRDPHHLQSSDELSQKLQKDVNHHKANQQSSKQPQTSKRNEEMPAFDEMMKPLRGWHFQNLNNHNDQLQPFESHWKLDSLQNITLAGLYCLATSGPALKTSSSFLNQEAGFDSSHIVEPMDTDSLPDPMAKIDLVIRTQEPLNSIDTPDVSSVVIHLGSPKTMLGHELTLWKTQESLKEELFPSQENLSSNSGNRLEANRVTLAADLAELERLTSELESLEHLPEDISFSPELALELGSLKDEISAIKLEREQLSNLLPTRGDSIAFSKKVNELHEKTLSINGLLAQFQIKGLKFARGEQHLNELIHFLSSSPEKVSNQLLLHVAGDPYGQKTLLEGGKATQNLRYLLSILDKRMSFLSDKSFCTDAQRVGYCQALLYDLELANHFSLSADLETFSSLKNQITKAIELGDALDESSFDNYYLSFRDTIDGLKDVSDSFFFPIRWPGHALSMEVIKDQNGQFVVRIYNLGQGSEIQANSIVENTNKILPFTEIVGITEKNIKDKLFHNLLWRMNQSKNTELGPNVFYKTILELLQGVSTGRSFSIEEYLTPSRAGTCSYASLNAVFSQKMTNTLNPKRFDWEVQFKTIVDFYQQHMDILPNEQMTRANLKKALSEFSLVTKKLSNKGIITPSELAFAVRKIEGISHALNSAEQIYVTNLQNQRLQPDLVSDNLVSPVPETLGPIPYSYAAADSWKESVYPAALSNPIPSLIPTQKCTPENIENYLKAFVEKHRLASINSQNPGYLLQNYLETKKFIQSLPGVNSEFWNQISQEDLPRVIEQIGDLSFRYFHNIVDLSVNTLERNNLISTSDFMPSLKLITILDKLGQHISDGTPRFNLYQKAFGEILNSQNPLMSIDDPQSIQLLQELREYWKYRIPSKGDSEDFVSFFGVEITPNDLIHSEGNYELKLTKSEREGNKLFIRKNIYGQDVFSFYNWEYQQWAVDYLDGHLQTQEDLRYALSDLHEGQDSKKYNLETLALYSMADEISLKKNAKDPQKTKQLNREYLPKDFYTSRDVSFITDYLLKGMLNQRGVQELFPNDRLNAVANVARGNRGFLTLFHYTESNYKLHPEHSKLGKYRTTLANDVQTHSIGHMFANTPPPSETAAEIWKSAEQRRRYSPEEIFGKSLEDLGLKYKTVEMFGEERLRELLLLSSIPETQISETLSFFSQHSDLLDNPEMRWLFESLILEPPLLAEALNKDSYSAHQLIEKFGKLLTQQYDDLLRNEESLTRDVDESYLLFIIHINRVLEDYINNNLQSEALPKNYTSPIPNLKHKIFQIIEQATSPSLKSALNRELAISYGSSPTLNEEDFINFITAKVGVRLATPSTNDKLANIELQIAATQQSDNIKLLLDGDKRDQLLNRIVGKFIHNLDPQAKWQYFDHFPLLISGKGDNKIVFDIVQGKIWTSSGVLGVLPSEISQNPIINLLKIDPSKTEVYAKGDKIWHLKTQDGSQYRVNENGPIIQKMINDEWYQFDNSQNLALKSLIRDKINWVLKKPQGDLLIHIEDAKTGKPFALVESRTSFFYPPEAEGRLTVFTESEYLSLSQKDYQTKDVKIFKLDPNTGEKTNYLLEDVSNSNSAMHFLKDIENPSEVLFWKEKSEGLLSQIGLQNPTFRPALIELPRLGISFVAEEKNGEINFVSKELDGYHIAKDQGHPSMGDNLHYLVLEKGQSKRILIPRNPYKALKDTSSLTPTSILDNTSDRSRFLIYKIDPKTQKLIIPDNEARCLLAMTKLWHHKYQEAVDLLKGVSTHLRQLTYEEREIIEWITKLTSSNLDHTPEAAIVQLHAQALLMQNQRDFGFTKHLPNEIPYLENEVLAKATHKNYLAYLSDLSRWGNLALSLDEELFINKELRNILLHVIDQDILIERERQIQGGQFSSFDESLAHLHPSISFTTEVNSKSYKIYDIENLKNVFPFAPKLDEVSRNLLESNLNPEFYEIYRAVKENTPSAISEAITKLTGMVYPKDMTKDELKQELQRVLYLVAVLTEYKNQDDFIRAWVILNVLKKPDKFPTIEELFGNKRDVDWLNLNVISKLSERFYSDINSPKSSNSYERTITPINLSSENQVSKDVTPSVAYIIKKPLIEEFEIAEKENYVVKTPPKNLVQEKSNLLNLFNLKTDDAVAERMLSDLRNGIAAYEGTPEAQSFQIKDWQKVYGLGQQLKIDFSDTFSIMSQLQTEIEGILNKEADVSTEGAEIRLEKARNERQHLDINDGIFFFLRRSPDVIQKLNPHLNPADLKALLDKIQIYLTLSTNQQHRSRIITCINEISNVRCLETNNPECVIPAEMINKLGREMHSKRAYEAVEHPEYLVLEHYMEKMFWPNQVAALEKLHIEKGLIGSPEYLGMALELIMASGKSSVLLPLLSLLHADGNHLAIGIMPASLLPEASEGMNKVIGKAFRQMLEVIEIDRDKKLGVRELKSLYSQLETAVKEKHVILMSDSDVKNLYLRFTETLNKLKNKSSLENDLEFHEYKRIFQLLKKSGIATIDEIDTIGNVLFSQHFTIDDQSPPHVSILEGTEAFFRAFMKVPQIKERFLNEDKSLAFEQELDLANEKESLFAIIAEELVSGNSFQSKSEMKKYLSSLSSTEKDFLKKYLMGSNDKQVFSYIEKNIGDQNIQDTLSVVREQLTVLAPLTLSRKTKLHFGFREKEEPLNVGPGLVSAPFNNGVSSKNSQFGTDLEMISYTYLQNIIGYNFLGKGNEDGENQTVRHIPTVVIAQELEGIREQLLKEHHMRKNIPIEQLPSFAEFKKYFNEIPASINILKKFPDKIIRKAHKRISQDPELIIDLVSKNIMPHLAVYRTQLNANAQIYKYMFGVSNQFSGSLWNLESLPAIYREAQLSDTSQKTLFLLESNSPKFVPVVDTSNQSLQGVLSQIYSRHAEASSINDAAGALLSWENEQVAKEMLAELQKKDSTLLGVAFCDKNNRWMVWTGSGEPHLHSTTALSPNEIAVYWDLPHTTGSDIPTRPKEQAITFIGKHTTLRDIFQTVWRLRKLDQGQSSAFAIDQSDAKAIKAVLEGIMKQPINGDLELKHLLQYALYKQAKMIGDHNYRALINRLDAVLIEQIWGLWLDPSINPDKAVEIFENTMNLFLTTNENRPYDMYGKPQSEKNREVIAKELLDSYLNGSMMQFLSTNDLCRSRIDIEAIKEKLTQIVQETIPLLSKQLKSGQNYGLQKQMQSQKNTQQQTQKETEQETQKSTRQFRKENYHQRSDKIQWSDQGLFTKAYFENRIEMSVDGVFPIPEKNSQSFVSLTTYANAWTNREKFAPKYSSGLISTINLSPIHLHPMAEAAPFAKSQQYVRKMLVTQDKQTGRLEAILLNKDDIKHFQKNLLNKPGDNPELRIALYDLETGFEMQGTEPIENLDGLEKSSEFLMLKVQAKFFAGRSDYDDDEIPQLKKWLEENDPQKMYVYFQNQVLRGKSESLKQFSSSMLRQVFSELDVVMR